MIFDNIVLPNEVDDWINQGKSFQMIDLTEENLLSKSGIESNWIPARELINQTERLRTDVPVVLCCYSGESSFMLMNILFYTYKLQNVFSLKTGIKGWKGI